jgi:hypothetical protein
MLPPAPGIMLQVLAAQKDHAMKADSISEPGKAHFEEDTLV